MQFYLLSPLSQKTPRYDFFIHIANRSPAPYLNHQLNSVNHQMKTNWGHKKTKAELN